jgi:hypothetical protein
VIYVITLMLIVLAGLLLATLLLILFRLAGVRLPDGWARLARG